MNTTKSNAKNFMSGLGIIVAALMVARAATGVIMSLKVKTPSIVLLEWC
jgi:hypothetical protein